MPKNDVNFEDIKKAQNVVADLKNKISAQKVKHDEKLKEAEECSTKAGELCVELKDAERECDRIINAASATLGLA